MNKLGLIESLRQQITSLEDEVEARSTQDGEHLDEMDVAHRLGMINQCEVLIDQYEQDTEPEVNGHELKRLVEEYRKAEAERYRLATEWGKANPSLPFRDSPDCDRTSNNVRQLEDQISAIFIKLGMDAGLLLEEFYGFNN